MKSYLPAIDRVLVHLEKFIKLKDRPSYPMAMTQEGMANALGVKRGYLQQLLKELIEYGSVACILHRVEGGRKLMKTYFLTSRGVKEAARLKEAIKSGLFTATENESGQPTGPAENAPAPEPELTDWRQTAVEGGDATVLKNDYNPARRNLME